MTTARAWRRGAAPIAGTAGSAALFGLAFPPVDARLLAWVALVPFLLALRGRGLRTRLALGWLWGVLAAYSVGVWFASAVAEYFLQPMAVAVALFLAVASLMVAPYVMLFAALHPRAAEGSPLAAPLAVAALWTATEWLRGRLFTGTPFFVGNPWGLIGYSQTADLPLMQIASVTGIYGVSFAVVAVNAALAGLWAALRRADGRDRRAAWLGAGAVVLLVGALQATGRLALREAERWTRATPAVEVALVQGNVSIGSIWRSDLYGRNLEHHLRLTWDALAKGDPRVVFWPESAMTFFVEEEPAYRRSIASVLAQGPVELVAGAPRRLEGEPPRYTNSVWLIGSDGTIGARYDKEVLLPLAEYFPLRDVSLLRRSFGRVREFEFGTATDPLPTAAGRAGVAICNEAMLPEVVAARVARGATYLLNPSNDTWLAHPQYTAQQFRIAATRAVEQRRTLVRVSTAGPSAIVDPWGRVLARTDAGSAAAIVGPVRARRAPSTYHRVGDLFATACAAASLAVALLPLRRRARR